MFWPKIPSSTLYLWRQYFLHYYLPFICFSSFLPLNLSFCPPLCLSTCLSFLLSFFPLLYLFLSAFPLPICLSTCLPFLLSAFPPVCLFSYALSPACRAASLSFSLFSPRLASLDLSASQPAAVSSFRLPFHLSACLFLTRSSS